MYEYFQILATGAITLNVYFLIRILERIQNTESKLDALLNHFGIEWGKFSEPSNRVKELAKDPSSRIMAIKAYREQTGLGLKDAKDVIEKLAGGSKT
jgi:ribosomal protein L7/L12